MTRSRNEQPERRAVIAVLDETYGEAIARLLPGFVVIPAAKPAPAEGFTLIASGDSALNALRLAQSSMARAVAAIVLESPILPDPLPEDEAFVPPDIPVLLLVGTRDDHFTLAERRRVHASIPDSYLALVYDAGRSIHHDQPAAFADIVGDFARRLDGFVVAGSAPLS